VIVESEALYARHEMLEELTNYECTEMSDAIERLAGAARTLIGLGDYPNAQLALIAGENVARDYFDYLEGYCDCWEEYSAIPEELFNYFSPYDKMSKDTFDGRE
jgi:hypothetical protein